MILYRTQPINTTQSNITHALTKKELMNDLGMISSINNKSIEYADFVTLVTDASIVDGLLTSAGYGNILVVTSFEDKNYEKIRDRNYRPVLSAGDHLLPVVHTKNQSQGNIYVTMTKNADNYMKPIYDKYDINTLDVDSYFRIDGDFRIKTDILFDCVVLLGCESYKKGKFKSSDIKKKFAKYCNPDFDLVDVYRNVEEPRKITGGTKDITQHIERMIECVNTPSKVYDRTTRVVPEANYMRNMRNQLMYYRLALNLEKVNEYYRVY